VACPTALARAHLLQVTVEIKSEPVAFPAVTLCNFRNLDFDVMNRITDIMTRDKKPSDYDVQQDYGTVEDADDLAATEQDYDYPEYVEHFYDPSEKFDKEYLKFVSNLTNIVASKRYDTDPQVQLAVQVNYALQQGYIWYDCSITK